MSEHNWGYEGHGDQVRASADPGASGTITIDRQLQYVPLVSATAETRTLARPTRKGVVCFIFFETDGGDITLTVTGGYDAAGSTTKTLNTAGQLLMFVSRAIGTTYSWELVSETVPGGGNLITEAGVGITSGTGTVYQSSVTEVGGIIITRILLDVTGLDSSGTADDIIGKSTGGAAHLGRITTAQNGTIFGGRITCLEVPLTGDPDIDFYAADEATGVFDDAVGATLTETKLINTGDWTLETDTLTALPAANQYLYAVAGATDDATYTAGQFLIELYGYRA